MVGKAPLLRGCQGAALATNPGPPASYAGQVGAGTGQAAPQCHSGGKDCVVTRLGQAGAARGHHTAPQALHSTAPHEGCRAASPQLPPLSPVLGWEAHRQGLVTVGVREPRRLSQASSLGPSHARPQSAHSSCRQGPADFLQSLQMSWGNCLCPGHMCAEQSGRAGPGQTTTWPAPAAGALSWTEVPSGVQTTCPGTCASSRGHGPSSLAETRTSEPTLGSLGYVMDFLC